jgi:hypothetical protein
MLFPTIIVENFFEKPKELIDFSKKLEYEKDKVNSWPGVRSKSFHIINEKLYLFVIKKVLSYFYDFNLLTLNNEEMLFDNTYVGFHKIKEQDIKGFKDLKHRDYETHLAGLIYLNNENNIKTGTKLYSDCKVVKNSFILPKEKLIISNKFNTMVAYDGNNLHGPSGFLKNNKERLNIVFFINKIITKKFPIERANLIKGF